MEFIDFYSRLEDFESYQDDDGYIQVMVGRQHPYNNKGYVRAHRLAMEQHLNRYLMTSETVHHINEIKNDNRLDNLYLCSQEEHVAIHNRGTKHSLERRTNIMKGVNQANRERIKKSKGSEGTERVG